MNERDIEQMKERGKVEAKVVRYDEGESRIV